MASGKYIAIEGISGVGKSVVIEGLARELQAAQIPVQVITDGRHSPDITAQALQRIIDDPRYPMNTRAEVLLYNAAYSQMFEDIGRMVNAGTVCIVDHSYLTTLVMEYYGRGDITDYATANQIIQYAVGHARPDLLLLLDAPVSTIKGRLGADRQNGFDEAYQERVRAGYLWEAKQRNLPIVYTTDPVDTVLATAWKLVSNAVGVPDKDALSSATSAQSVAEVLAANPPTKVAPVEPPITTTPSAAPNNPVNSSVTSDTPGQKAETPAEPSLTPAANHKPSTQKHDDSSENTPEARQANLVKYFTNTTGSVYGFSDDATPAIVSAALTRSSSNNGSNIRAALLDELAGDTSQEATPHQQAVTTFDADRIREFMGHSMVVEDVSQLLAATFKQGGLVTCLEFASRTTDFSGKDANGHYRYVIPGSLKGRPRSTYIRTMNQIFDTYAKLVVSVTAHLRATSTVPAKEQDVAWRSATKARACSIVRPLLPVAAATTLGIRASDQVLGTLATDLLDNHLPEARSIGRQIGDELRKIDAAMASGQAESVSTDNTAAARATVRKPSADWLPTNHTAETKPVTLASYSPRNELDLVADILYAHSDLPLQKIQQESAGWPYQRKVDILASCLSGYQDGQHTPGHALEKIHYSFDLVSDFDTFSALQSYPMGEDTERQGLSPRLGYEVPAPIDEAGATEAFEQCFDLSLQLYSELQAAGLAPEAQYATLLGHKLRWKTTYNAHELVQLRGLNAARHESLGRRKLFQQIYAEVSEVHPIIAGTLQFANSREKVAAKKVTANNTPEEAGSGST